MLQNIPCLHEFELLDKVYIPIMDIFLFYEQYHSSIFNSNDVFEVYESHPVLNFDTLLSAVRM